MLMEINKTILIQLNGLTQHSIVENMVYIFADAPIFFLPIFLVSAWIYYSIKKDLLSKQDLLYIFYSCIIGILIALLIQIFIQLDRPETVLENSGKLLLSHIPDASFPSDHATVSFAFLTALFLSGYKKIGYIFLPFVVIMNLSRIIAGVHWPFDILIGALIGVVSAFISFRYLVKQKLVKSLNEFIIKLLSYFKL